MVEDLCTAYWKENFNGGYLKKDTAIEFFKKFVDLVNFYHIQDEEFFINLSDEDRYVVEWMESIAFYDSVAVITKLDQPRSKPYSRINTGNNQPITKVK